MEESTAKEPANSRGVDLTDEAATSSPSRRGSVEECDENPMLHQPNGVANHIDVKLPKNRDRFAKKARAKRGIGAISTPGAHKICNAECIQQGQNQCDIDGEASNQPDYAAKLPLAHDDATPIIAKEIQGQSSHTESVLLASKEKWHRGRLDRTRGPKRALPSEPPATEDWVATKQNTRRTKNPTPQESHGSPANKVESCRLTESLDDSFVESQPGAHAVSLNTPSDSADSDGWERGRSTRNGMDDGFVAQDHSTQSLVEANLVDDAEPVFIAKDVKADRFKRHLAWGFLCLLFAVATAVLMAVFLNPSDDAPKTGDPICWPPVSKQSVFVRCYCTNSTGRLYEELSPEAQQGYQEQIEFSPTTPMWPYIKPEGEWGIDSCVLANMIPLHFAVRNFWLEGAKVVKVSKEAFSTGVVMFHTYITMDGIHWKQSDLWGETMQICRWFGVGCLFGDVFHELRLPNNGLSGTISPIFQVAANLRVLDLSNNNITGQLPSELASIYRLNTLILSELQLTGTIPPELCSLDKLGMLSLDDNQLTGPVPPEMFDMSALRELELAGNHLNGTLPHFSSGTSSQLSILRINDNSLTGSLPPDMVRLSNLEILNLGNNSFSGSIPDFLGEMAALQFIGLQNSGLTGTIPESFCENRAGRLRSEITVMCDGRTEWCSCCSQDRLSDADVKIRCSEDGFDFGR